MNAVGATSLSFDNTTTITPGALSASVNASPNPVSAGQVVTLTCKTAGGTPPYTYAWTLGDGSTSTASSLSHMYSTPGAMAVVCTVTDNLSVQASATITVMVN